MKTTISNVLFFFFTLAIVALISTTASSNGSLPGFLHSSSRALVDTTPTAKEMDSPILDEIEQKFDSDQCTLFHRKGDQQIIVVCTSTDENGTEEQLKFLVT